MPIKFQQKHFHRLYLAGPITGVPDYKERFAEAERDFSEHYDVINPARILEGVDDRDCLPLCLRLIDRADSVVLLPGWRSSMGAVTEALYAIRQGKSVTAYERKDAAYSVSWDGKKLTGGSTRDSISRDAAIRAIERAGWEIDPADYPNEQRASGMKIGLVMATHILQDLPSTAHMAKEANK